MHVIQVISAPSGGGAELLVRQLAAALPARGVGCTAVYLTNPKQTVLASNEVSLDLSSPWDPRVLRRLRRLVREAARNGPVVVHAHLVQALYLTPLALAFTGTRLVFTEHNTFNRRRGVPLFAPFERLVYSRYARIVSISRGVRQALKRWLGGGFPDRKLTVIDNGARLFAPAQRGRPQKLRLLSVGSLTPKKGLETAVAAVGTMRDAVEEYRIVGEGPCRAALTAQAADLGLGDKVRFSGWADDIEAAYREADVLVLPSRWEGFGLVAVEALSTGLPVVCSNVDGVREIAEGCPSALLFPPGDAEALARILLEVDRRLKAGEDLASAAVARASHYSLDRMVDSYVDLYKAVAAEGR